MKRFCFCPLWKIERTEQWLKQMEAEGNRLEKVTFMGMLYHFKSAKPRLADYIFVYTSLKEKDMSLVADGLKSTHSANEISTNASILSLYRVTNPCDLTFEKETRFIYFRTRLLAMLLLSLSMGAYVTLLAFALKWFGVMYGGIAISLLFVAYYLYGFIYTVIRVRRIDLKNNKHRK